MILSFGVLFQMRRLLENYFPFEKYLFPFSIARQTREETDFREISTVLNLTAVNQIHFVWMICHLWYLSLGSIYLKYIRCFLGWTGNETDSKKIGIVRFE